MAYMQPSIEELKQKVKELERQLEIAKLERKVRGLKAEIEEQQAREEIRIVPYPCTDSGHELITTTYKWTTRPDSVTA